MKQISQEPLVLLVTNLFPTSASPSGGVFITQRINAHLRQGVRVVPIAISPSAPKSRSPARSVSDGLSLPPFLTHSYNNSRIHSAVRRWNFPDHSIATVASSIVSTVDFDEVDVIHAHGMYGIPAGAIAEVLSERTGKPFVVSLHGSDVNALMPRYPGQHRNVLSRAAATIYVSEALRRTANAMGAPTRDSHVVPNGYDPEVFAPKPTRVTHPSYCFIGGLFQVKGADRLPQIIRTTLRLIPEARFVIVGDGPLRRTLERQTRNMPVTYTGTRDQVFVAEIMRRSVAVMLPSRSEGWPCVVMEAYATGTPVVGMDVGGVREALMSPEHLVDPSSAECLEEFAEILASLWPQSVDEDHLRKSAERFTWDAVAAAEGDILIGRNRH